MFVYLLFAAIAYLILPATYTQYSVFLGWVGLSLLTGFFHEDGLADTADSLGVSKFDSGPSLEKIHSTFKDPRLGTFGVSALVLFWLSRYSLSQNSLFSPVLCAFVCLWSRATSLGLGLYFYSRVPRSRSARSSHVMQHVDGLRASIHLLAAVMVGMLFCFGLGAHVGELSWSLEKVSTALLDLRVAFIAFLLPVVGAGLLLWLVVRRTEALNGDLLGAAVCTSEMFIMIGLLLGIESLV
ncbi:MAG: adenosylcobinamide-GDP ribazoletransferase [Pseudomonadota bacterium]